MVGRLYAPDPLVVVSREKLVCCSVATTFAPTTAAWLASVTFPVILPWSNCARAGSTETVNAPKTAKKATTNAPDPHKRCILLSPPVRHSPDNPLVRIFRLPADCCGPASLRTSRSFQLSDSRSSPTTPNADTVTVPTD